MTAPAADSFTATPDVPAGDSAKNDAFLPTSNPGPATTAFAALSSLYDSRLWGLVASVEYVPSNMVS